MGKKSSKKSLHNSYLVRRFRIYVQRGRIRKTNLFQLFVAFLKIGSITFGGGYAMLPFIYREIGSKRRWLDDDELLDVLTIAQSVPGAIAVNSAFLIGYRKNGITGALISVFGMVLPAFLIIVSIMLFFLTIREITWIRNFMTGIITASAALIFMSGAKLSSRVFRDYNPINIAIGIAAFLMVGLFDINVIWLISAGLVYGLIRHLAGFKTELSVKKIVQEKVEDDDSTS